MERPIDFERLLRYHIVFGRGYSRGVKVKDWARPFWFLFTIGWFVALGLVAFAIRRLRH